MNHNKHQHLTLTTQDIVPHFSLWQQLYQTAQAIPAKYPKVVAIFGVMIFLAFGLLIGLATGFIAAPALLAASNRRTISIDSTLLDIVPDAPPTDASIETLTSPITTLFSSVSPMSAPKREVNTNSPPVPPTLIEMLNNRTDSDCLVTSFEGLPSFITLPLLNLTCANELATNSTHQGLGYAWNELPPGTDTNSLYSEPFDATGGDLSGFSTTNSFFPRGIIAGGVPLQEASFNTVFMPYSLLMPHFISVGGEHRSTTGLSIQNADISYSVFQGYFVQLTLSSVNASGVRFKDSTYELTTWSNVLLNGADLRGITAKQTHHDNDDDDGCTFDTPQAVDSNWAGATLHYANGKMDLSGAIFSAPEGIRFWIVGSSIDLRLTQANGLSISGGSDMIIDAPDSVLAGFSLTSSNTFQLNAPRSNFTGADFRSNSRFTVNASHSIMGDTQLLANQDANIDLSNSLVGPDTTWEQNQIALRVDHTHFSGSGVHDNTFTLHCPEVLSNPNTQSFFTRPCTKAPPPCITADPSFFKTNTFPPRLCPGIDHDGFQLSIPGIFIVTLGSTLGTALLAGLLCSIYVKRQISAARTAVNGHDSGSIQEANETTLLTQHHDSEIEVNRSYFSC